MKILLSLDELVKSFWLYIELFKKIYFRLIFCFPIGINSQ